MNTNGNTLTSVDLSSSESAAYVENLSSKIVMRQLGLGSIRACLIDRHSMTVLKNWSLNSEKDDQDASSEAVLDQSFISAGVEDFNIQSVNAENTIVRKLSPRLWAITWLANTEQLVLVEARYTDPRYNLEGKEAALVRLLCLNLTQKDLQAVIKNLAADTKNPQKRIATQGTTGNWVRLVTLLLLSLSALFAGWMYLISLPATKEAQNQRQAELMRIQTMTDQTLTQRLTKSLAAGDYGDLEEELLGFYKLGYFPRALIINADSRVVASAGMGNLASIGDTLPDSIRTTNKVIPLKQGQDVLGSIICPERTTRLDEPSLLPMEMVAALSALFAIAATVFFLLFKPRP